MLANPVVVGVCSVPKASDGSTSMSISDSHSGSRPNNVMNQGAPAAVAAKMPISFLASVLETGRS